METVNRRLGEYLLSQNPSRRCITLEYGTRRRWRAGRARALGYLLVAGVSLAIGYFGDFV